jgi:hypothetical protein
MTTAFLSQEYLPAFIYLIDGIRKDDGQPDYRKIAFEAIGVKKEIDARSIQRTFELRDYLYGEYNKKVHRAKRKTLNVITTYYFDDLKWSFSSFAKQYDAEVKAYCAKNPPLPDRVAEVFKSEPEKTEHLRKQIAVYENLLEETREKDLASFMEEIQFYVEKKQKTLVDEIQLKDQLIRKLEARLERVEAQLAKSHWVYRIFGPFGLFFVTIDYGMPDKVSVLNDFFEGHGLGGTDLLDDVT